MSTSESDSELTLALKPFDAAEANLAKLERIWSQLEAMIPQGIAFCENTEYEELCRSFDAIADALPAISGWKFDERPMPLDTIAQMRLDAKEVDEFACHRSTEQWIAAPGAGLREYRFRLKQKRRELVRSALVDLITKIDGDLQGLRGEFPKDSHCCPAISRTAFVG